MNSQPPILKTQSVDTYNLRFQTQQAFIYAGAYYGEISPARFYEIQAALDEHEVSAMVEKLLIAGIFHMNRIKNALRVFSILSIFLGLVVAGSYFIIDSAQLAILLSIFLALSLGILGVSFFHYLTCPLIHFTILYRNFCSLKNSGTLFEESNPGDPDDTNAQ